MNDLISRKEAIEWCLEGLNNLPSVRHKGEWIYDGYRVKGGIDWVHCSECGQLETASAKINFCPNCGADMRGE